MKHFIWLLIPVITIVPFAVGQEQNKSYEEILRQLRPRIPEQAAAAPHKFSSPTPFHSIKVNQDLVGAPQNEPSVRINPMDPDNIVCAFRDFRLGWEPAIRNVTIATTTDAGKTWIEQFASYADHNRYSDPAVGVDLNGIFYVLALDYKEPPEDIRTSNQTVQMSENGGITWYPGIPIDPVDFHDKGMIYVDDSPTSPCAGYVYVGSNTTYLGYSGQKMSRSINGGWNWNPPVSVSGVGGYITPTTGPNGEVYVVGFGNIIKIVKSTDCGVTYDQAIDVSDHHQPSGVWISDWLYSIGEPVVAVDKSNSVYHGTVYVSWLSLFHGDGDIFCSKSTDGGLTWQPSVRVNNDSIGNGRDQFHHWMTVDDSGFVDLIFLDRRNDPANIYCDAFFAQSRDGGRTFRNFKVTEENFDPRIAPNYDVRYGEYMGIDARQGRIVPVWVDTHLGNQDIFITIIDQRKTATIKGTISSFCSDALGNLPVTLQHEGGVDTTWTDSNGNYSFAGLFQSMYDVNFSLDPTWHREITPTSYTVVIDSYEVESGINFNLKPSNDAEWKLISLMREVSPESSAVSINYPGLTYGFGYNSSYQITETLQFGYGYWLKFYCTLPEQMVAGDSVVSDTIQVRKGWNMIGTLSVPLLVTSITSLPLELVTSPFYGYIDEMYKPVDILLPGNGYWVKATDAGSLFLNVEASKMSSVGKIQIVNFSELPPLPPFEKLKSNKAVPKKFTLKQNYPNPFNPMTTIDFTLAELSVVTLKIYNMLGQEVMTLLDKAEVDEGEQSVEFDASHLSSGIYFYKINAQGIDENQQQFQAIKRMVLVK